MDSKKLSSYILGFAIIGMGVASYLLKLLESPAREALLLLFCVYGAWRVFRAYNME
jgi:hypothetical protein